MPTGIYQRTEKQINQAKENIKPFHYKKGDNKGIHPKTEFKKGGKKPKNAYKFSVGHKNYNPGLNKGKHWKIKDTSKMKGKKPWNAGTKGLIKPNSGSFKKGTPIEKHPRWLNGKSFEPYGLEFNEDLKEVIRNRDRRKCFICEKTELENKEKLTVHHKDYDKQNNNPNNLISLCRKCHIKTNRNRNYWPNYFKQILTILPR